MALKHVPPLRIIYADFGTIRNNTALKRTNEIVCDRLDFGTIRNNTALKPSINFSYNGIYFGTIRNNTALKPRGPIFVTTFRNRAIHLS
ncbi:TPA: hypothetical protein ACPQW4_001230 [Streptococcus mutans]